MGIKKHKAYTPSRRYITTSDFKEITKKKPTKSLTKAIKRTGGRNNTGRVTVRSRGGGAKRKYRVIDTKRDKLSVPAKVESIEYDPTRSCRIALLCYRDGERRYIIAPYGLNVGDTVSSGPEAEIKVGNSLPIEVIPEGVEIHNIELLPGKGGQLVRAAGSSAVILSKEGKYAHIQLPSGEVRLINLRCMATVGRVSNPEHENITLGKAGRKRWLGRRPHTRGVAMNPVDHPLGGGEGRSKGGRPPTSPTGVISKGKRTRKKAKPSDRFIVKRRR